MERIEIFGEDAQRHTDREIHIEQGDDVVIVDQSSYRGLMERLYAEGERFGWPSGLREDVR